MRSACTYSWDFPVDRMFGVHCPHGTWKRKGRDFLLSFSNLEGWITPFSNVYNFHNQSLIVLTNVLKYRWLANKLEVMNPLVSFETTANQSTPPACSFLPTANHIVSGYVSQLDQSQRYSWVTWYQQHHPTILWRRNGAKKKIS